LSTRSRDRRAFSWREPDRFGCGLTLIIAILVSGALWIALGLAISLLRWAT
jgi:hypothetical protein